MKIAIDARPLAHPHSGIGRYLAEILWYFLEISDHSFYLYGITKRQLPTRFLPHLDARLLTRATHPENSQKLSSVGMQILAPLYSALDRIDVFFSPRHHLPLLVQAPCIVTIHDLTWIHAPETMQPGGRLIERILMPRSIRKARKIICVSDFTKNQITKHFGGIQDKVIRIYEAAFASATTSESSLSPIEPIAVNRPDTFNLLFVGTIEPRKNLERILEAVAKLRQKGRGNLTLNLVSNNSWRTDIVTLIEGLELDSVVQIHDAVDDATLLFHYQNADALIFPSLYEGFGLPVLEAMTHGLPVITSQDSAMSEIANNEAILVDARSIQSIANGIELGIANPELLSELRRKGVGRASQFSWHQAASETLGEIQELYRSRSS